MFDINTDRNRLPLRQYNLIVTGTNWTTYRAIGIPYQTVDGAWRIKLNISGAMTSASRTGMTLTVANISFASTSPGDGQDISAYEPAAAAMCGAYTGTSNGQITIYHSSTTTTTYNLSGDVELASKPSFVIE